MPGLETNQDVMASWHPGQKTAAAEVEGQFREIPEPASPSTAVEIAQPPITIEVNPQAEQDRALVEQLRQEMVDPAQVLQEAKTLAEQRGVSPEKTAQFENLSPDFIRGLAKKISVLGPMYHLQYRSAPEMLADMALRRTRQEQQWPPEYAAKQEPWAMTENSVEMNYSTQRDFDVFRYRQDEIGSKTLRHGDGYGYNKMIGDEVKRYTEVAMEAWEKSFLYTRANRRALPDTAAEDGLGQNDPVLLEQQAIMKETEKIQDRFLKNGY